MAGVKNTAEMMARMAALAAYLEGLAAAHRDAGRLAAADTAEGFARDFSEYLCVTENGTKAYQESIRCLEEQLRKRGDG